LVGNNKKNTNVSDKYINLRRQTTAIIEPSVLEGNVTNKKTKNKNVLHNIRGMENPNNACYANSDSMPYKYRIYNGFCIK